MRKQADAGLDFIPVGDFSLYDHILDLSVQFGVIPNRFAKEEINLDLFFAIARGNKENVASSMKNGSTPTTTTLFQNGQKLNRT